MTEEQLDVGVIGVGSMGQHHTRVYRELSTTNLVGVFDVDHDAAASVASEYATEVVEKEELLDRADAVSVVVPTQYHFDEALTCIEAGVGTLIEKPVVEDPKQGRKLDSIASKADVPVQVGHIERFNPAIRSLQRFVSDLKIHAIKAERLGPPPGREIEDSAVIDLMIHDIDIVLSLLGQKPTSVESTGIKQNRHASALLEFNDDIIANLTASRMTQRKVRRIEITAEDCFVDVDYLDQSINIHRGSVPEFIKDNGEVRYRHESIIERPTVSSGEPLKNELSSFAETVQEGGTPEVTIEDGVRAIEVASEIEQSALNSKNPKTVMSNE